jgi:hypothetical protein
LAEVSLRTVWISRAEVGAVDQREVTVELEAHVRAPNDAKAALVGDLDVEAERGSIIDLRGKGDRDDLTVGGVKNVRVARPERHEL